MLNKKIIKTLLTTLSLLTLSTMSYAKVDFQLEGEVIQGSLLVGKTSPGSQVFYDEAPLKLSRHGYFTFGFSRDDTETHKLHIKAKDGEQLTQYLSPKPREYNIQKVEGIDKKIMSPNKAALERVAQDSIQIKAARAVASENIDFAHGFKAPAKGRITGVYGSQRFYNGVPKNPHFGLDYAGPEGTLVKAPAAGIITLWVSDMFYSGGTMIIDHGHGITSTFLHLSGSKVKVGDQVKQGQNVAMIGTTGRSTGPHLDWRVNWHNVRLDPAFALKLPNFHTYKK